MDEKKNGQQLPEEKEDLLSESIEKHLQQAREGDVLAQFELGRCYYELNRFEESFRWWEQAAEQGFSPALVRLAVQYAEGQGTARREDLAMDCVRKAVETDPENANALCYLGMFYEQGLGTPSDIEQAISCYQKSTEMGDAMAPFMMAMCYLRGNGVKRDQSAVMEWALTAADRGNPDAQYFVGMEYFLGEMSEVNMEKAIQYLKKAVDGGSPDAQPLLDLVEQEVRVDHQRRQVKEMEALLDEYEAFMTTGAMEEALWDDWDDMDENGN